MVHEWPPHTRRVVSRARVRLTRSQRWDIARMTAAGVVTIAALGCSAWLIAPHEDRPGTAAAVEPEQLDPAVTGAAAPGVTIRTAEVVAAVVREEAPAPAARGTAREPGHTPALNASAAARPSHAIDSRPSQPTLPRRIARFITGDGRHEVRPFPTVPDERF